MFVMNDNHCLLFLLSTNQQLAFSIKCSNFVILFKMAATPPTTLTSCISTLLPWPATTRALMTPATVSNTYTISVYIWSTCLPYIVFIRKFKQIVVGKLKKGTFIFCILYRIFIFVTPSLYKLIIIIAFLCTVITN